MNEKKIAITGGTGYIGSRIAEFLLNNGFNVVILSRKNYDFLPLKLKKILKIVNYNDKASIQKALYSIDCIIHLMSINEIDAKKNPEEAVFINVYLTEIILQAAISTGVSQIIYFSTVHVYGKPLEGIIDETINPKPVHPYSIVHRAAEELINEKILTGKIDGVILRVSNGFGYPVYKKIKRWTLLLNDICRQAVEYNRIIIKFKNQKRDFISVTDIERAVEWFLVNNSFDESIFNLSSGITHTAGNVAEMVRKEYNNLTLYEVPVFYVDQIENKNDLIISNKKILETGFVFRNNYTEEISITLQKCLEWFRK